MAFKFFSSVSNLVCDTRLISWDALLALLNFVRRKRPVGHVTPEGHPGYGGHWPEYVPPQEGDSRCSCPGLNAMANHGIIPRNGRGVSFVELGRVVHSTYNFSPSFCSFTVHYAARILNKSYSKDTFDLQEIDLHNGIEHDASLFRLDTALQPDQSIKHIPFIEEVLAISTVKDKDGNDLMTGKDISKLLGKRRAVARAVNKDYSLRFAHRLFSTANSSTMITIFGGRIDDLRSFMLDERIPEGWESRVRQAYGLTMAHLNRVTLGVELGVREQDWAQVAQEEAERNAAITS